MSQIHPSMRLKVKRDTFFLPEPQGSVYFRNNVSSFRIEGNMIDQWVERLLPVFNGEYTMDELSDGLPDAYMKQMYDIAQVLYDNGFVRDVSTDLPHELPEAVALRYASQIEFLDQLGHSGGYRFQSYRGTRLLAVGSGPLMVSLLAALLESGLPKLHVLLTTTEPTDRERLMELAGHALQNDSEVALEVMELSQPEGETDFWRETLQSYDIVAYVSREEDVQELKTIHEACRREGKWFAPAMMVQQTGIAGPLVHPELEGGWESAWRRIHSTVLGNKNDQQAFSTTAGALLVNVLVFELFKKITGVSPTGRNGQLYLLNLETLEGRWHSYWPHPLATEAMLEQGAGAVKLPLDQDDSLEQEDSRLMSHLSGLTSSHTGILHKWEEEELIQLPLAQCCVQAVDPLTEGPAELLPEMIGSGLTHEEARREAGLAGLEAYAARLAEHLLERWTVRLDEENNIGKTSHQVSIGAGETVAEAVGRGLHQQLLAEMVRRHQEQMPSIRLVQLEGIDDTRCRFYFQALSVKQGAPIIGLGEELFGFPVAWVGHHSRWFAGVGLNLTFALRRALQQALLYEQNGIEHSLAQALESSYVRVEANEPLRLEIAASGTAVPLDLLQSAVQGLESHGLRLEVFNLAVEPFLKEELAGVFGVVLREEEVE
ncbi:putative thiazole-containing bacteriocin maturation protein [Paenibacillus sp. UNC451MF]|uniref:putative thiazole-containing bacteriocin maturation protein n=1 Tax=Paenibacillus sp. UNC451MF TaxID=1449063 RepID=UPI00048DA67B|nr:putative thiazole-containing bacteriocin maturation protein [Paenibacillus sp. UNC451MF]